VAIALIHAYRDGTLEHRIEALAEEVGFTHVSVSSEIRVKSRTSSGCSAVPTPRSPMRTSRRCSRATSQSSNES
jgi:hypothetical protein